MIELTELEHAVLGLLLAGEHPLLKRLRRQMDQCRATRREFTGAGSFTDLDIGSATPAGEVNIRFGDVIAKMEGMAHGAGFVLFVERGRLRMLEGYGYDDPWPDKISDFALEYVTGGTRDWAALEKDLQ